MITKVLVGILAALSVLFCSCYPELSVQQYDKLKKDIAELDTERKELKAELQIVKVELHTVKAELQTIKEQNAKTLAYIEFLNKLIFIQSLEMIVSGEFDVEALADSATELTSAAERLGDNNIIYYLGLIDPDNESQSIAAYYKVIEYCLKKMKQNLE